MKVRDIIADADQAIPNAVPVETKVRWLNELQDEIMPLIDMPRAEATIQTAAGVGEYDLPADCPPERIRTVVWEMSNGYRVELPHVDSAHGRTRLLYYYSIVPGERRIRVSPVPSVAGETIRIRYVRSPRPIAISPASGDEIGLDDEPDLPRANHSVYVWGLAARIAAALGDIQAEQLHVQRFQASLQYMVYFSSPNPDRGFIVETPW